MTSSASSPRAILLDLDGTLADSLSVMRVAYRLVLEKFQAVPTDAEFDSLNGPPLAEVVRRLKLSHALECNEEVLFDTYTDVIDQAYTAVAPCPGAIELLQKARVNGCVVGVVTSSSSKRTYSWIQTIGITHMIDFVVAGDEVEYGKPHAEPYLIATGKTSCPSDKIIAVEDSPQGALSAIHAGLKTFILIREGSNDRCPKDAVPIRSLTELAQQLW